MNNINNQEQLMKAVNALRNTTARRGIVVVGKGDTVISFPFSYYTKLEEQNEFKVHESAKEESFSRLNMLLAVTEIVVGSEPEKFVFEGIEMETHNFVPLFIPDIVFNQIDQSKYWSQKFKAMQSYERALAQIEKRHPRTLNFILDGKKRISAEEIMLWEALREEIAKRPYLNVNSIKTAGKFFTKDEVRARMTSAAVAKSWAKLQEMGVSIANFSTEGQFSDAGFENTGFEDMNMGLSEQDLELGMK